MNAPLELWLPPAIEGQVHLDGRAATIEFQRVMGETPGREFQVAHGNSAYHQCFVTADGFRIQGVYKRWHLTQERWFHYQEFNRLRDQRQEPLKGVDWEWRADPATAVDDGYAFMLKHALRGRSIFYKANYLVGGFDDNAFRHSTDIFCEDDERSLPEQAENIAALLQRGMVQPTAIVYSGGKSLQPHYRQSAPVDGEQFDFLGSNLCAVCGSDPAVVTLSRNMRMPGFPRQRKDGSFAEQTLLVANAEAVTSPEEFKQRLLGGVWEHKQPFDVPRFKIYKTIIGGLQQAKKLTDPQAAEAALKRLPSTNPYDAFDLDLERLLPRQTQTFVQRDTAGSSTSSRSSSTGANPWSALLHDELEPALKRLPLEAQYALGGFDHNFTQRSGKLVGLNPWTSNSSGTSFNVFADGGWSSWGTGEHGKIIEYLMRMRGNGSGTLYGKDFIDFVKWLADALGVIVPDEILHPKRGWQPSPEDIAELKRQEAEQEAIEAAQEAQDADLWFVENIRSVIKNLSRKVSQGFAKVKPRPPKPEPEPEAPETVVYKPGCIPDFVFGVKLPCYEYPASGKRDKEAAIAADAATLKQLLTEASAKGWRDPHDSSATGTGKTATWCGLDTEARVFYVSPMRAVTDAARAKFVPIVVRHNGNLIPDGKGGSRWAKPGDDPVGGGNCYLASTFHKLQHKGVTVVSAKAKQNPLCLSCVNSHDCADPKSAGANDGSGFRAALAALLSTQRWLRGTAASLPLFVGAAHGKTDWLLSGAQSRDEAEALEAAPVPDAQKRHVYVDEAGQVLQQNIVQTITASQSDMAKGRYRLESIAPEFHALLSPFWKALHKVSDTRSRFGADEAELLKVLPPPLDAWREAYEVVRPSLPYNLSDDLESADDDPEASARLKAVTKRLSSLEGKLASRERKLHRLNDELMALEHSEPLTPAQSDRLTEVERLKHKCLSEISEWQPEVQRLKPEREQLAYVRKTRRSQEKQSQSMQINALSESLPTQWVPPTLDVYFGLKHGDIRIDHNGALVITTLNETLVQNLKNADMVGTLDATLTPKMLAFYRGMDASEILHIRKQSAPTPNLTVKHIEGLGNCGGGKQSESRIERKKQVYEAVVKQHGCKPVTFDHKAHTPIWKALGVELDGHWRGEKTRGSNDFEQANVFLMFGGPRENLGSAQARHNVLSKWNRAQGLPVMPFEEFYDTETNAEILQAVGRARAVQRPNVPITVYIVWDDEQSKREQRYELPAALHAERISVDDFSPAAAAADSKTLLKLNQALAEALRRTGQAPTQAEMAEEAGYSQGYISKFFAAHFGGWRQGCALFLALLKPSNRARNNLLEHFAPDVLKALVTAFQALVTAPFRDLQRQIMTLYAELEGRPGLFAAFCAMLPESLRLSLVHRLCGTEPDTSPDTELEASPEAEPALDPPAIPVEPEPSMCAPPYPPPDPPATVAKPADVAETAATTLASTVVKPPRLNDVVSLNQDGQIVSAVVTAVPVESRDPKRRRQCWMARFEDGHERYVWLHEFLTIATSP